MNHFFNDITLSQDYLVRVVEGRRDLAAGDGREAFGAVEDTDLVEARDSGKKG